MIEQGTATSACISVASIVKLLWRLRYTEIVKAKRHEASHVVQRRVNLLHEY